MKIGDAFFTGQDILNKRWEHLIKLAASALIHYLELKEKKCLGHLQKRGCSRDPPTYSWDPRWQLF